MIKTMKYLLHCAAALALAACQHKELCYDHSHVVSLNVVFDWSEAPDATPASMSLYLFPKGEGEALRYEFTDRSGGTIRVPVGSYDALCLNSDTEGVVYRNTERHGTFEVSTRTTDLLASSVTGLGVRSDNAPRAEGTEGERIALTADRLWSGSEEDITLTESEPEPELTLHPVVSVRTYRVEITDAENLKYVSGLSATLSSMSGGILPCSAALSAEQVTHPFELRVGADKTTVEGEFLAFGHCPDMQSRHTLIVYAVLSDGSKYAYTFDADEVTSQLHEDPDAYEVTLRLSGLPLPEPIVNGGGFQPSVDEWKDVNIGIEM